MPSSASNLASPTDTRDSSPIALAAKAQAVVEKRRKTEPQPDVPSKPLVNTLKMPTLRSDEEVKKAEREKAERERESRKAGYRKNTDFPLRHVESMAETNGCDAWNEAAAKAWDAIDRGDSVLLAGNRGTGKTQMAVWCGQQMIERRAKSAQYIKAGHLFRKAIEAMHENRQTRYIESLVKLGLLIIDETHVRGYSDYEDRLLTDIVDLRYDNKRPTVLITNQTKEQAAKTFGPSIVSRYTESGQVIECNWKSFRGHA